MRPLLTDIVADSEFFQKLVVKHLNLTEKNYFTGKKMIMFLLFWYQTGVSLTVRNG